MTLYIASIAVLTVVIIMQSVIFYMLHKSQQRTIDALTDKLMVRMGHREYREPMLMQEEKPKRKPMSFYDDPSIEAEDDN